MPKVVRQPGKTRVTFETEQPESQAPPAPSVEDKSSLFWETVNSITDEEWGRERCVYLYRDNPKSNTRGSGNLEKITRAFDIDWVKQKYGGYDYRALLCDQNSKAMLSLSFSIDAPPKTPGETAQPAAAATSAESSGTAALAREIMGMLREELQSSRRPNPLDSSPTALQGLVDIFKAQVPAPIDPIELATKLKNLTAAPAAATDPMMALMMPVMVELMKKSIAGPQSGEDMLDKVDKLLVVAEKLGGRMGGKQSVFAVVAEKIAENVPQMLEAVGTVMDKWTKVAEQNRLSSEYRYAAAVAIANANAGKTALPGAPGAPPIPGVNRGPMPIPAPPGAPANVAPPTPAAPPMPGLHALDVEPVGAATIPGAPGGVFDLLAVVKDRVVNCIQRGDEGGVIVDFIYGMDERLVSAFVGMSEEELTAFFAADPILAQAITMPRFKECIAEMVATINDDPDLEKKTN